MELRELMKNENLSENDIIEAASIITKVCGSVGCPYCPLYFSKECHAKDMTRQFEGKALKRFRSLLYSNHMKKIAELLGVKFNETFHVSYGDGKGSMACYLDETGLHLSGMMYLTKSELLQDLLNGKAQIEKKGDEMMELRELMKKLEISEDYLIEAAQKMNEIHKRCTCEECPLNTEYGCATTTSAIVRVDEVVKKRIQELLHHNYMEKVAEMLGVKLGEKFVVATPTSDVVNAYYLTKQGIFSEDNMSAEITLSNLLIGNAHIIKGE